jgi:hypothetical protein
MMNIVINNRFGLSLLRPSHRHFKFGWTGKEWDWAVLPEKGPAHRRYPREVQIAPGVHEVERVDNPFVPGGESWLVLKGSQIGAAEAYLRRLGVVTHVPSTELEQSAGRPAADVRCADEAQAA